MKQEYCIKNDKELENSIIKIFYQSKYYNLYMILKSNFQNMKRLCFLKHKQKINKIKNMGVLSYLKKINFIMMKNFIYRYNQISRLNIIKQINMFRQSPVFIYKKHIIKFFSIFLLICSITSNNFVFSQDTINNKLKNKTVKGKVISNDGKPISNVSIGVEGAINTVYTDEFGDFELKQVKGDERVIITPSSDYKSKIIYINNRDSILVYLTPLEMQSGDDKISLVFKEIPLRNVVSSISNVNVNDLYKSEALSVDQFLQTGVSGMRVINKSGMPGDGSYNFLRGIRSLNTSNLPLYIVDGVPVLPFDVFNSNINGYQYNPLLTLNIHDISKVTVIKDPLYSVIYGSKGSNGVILIETLDPSVTKTVIDVNYSTLISLKPNYIPQLNGDEHKTLMNELLFSGGYKEEDIEELYPSLFYTPKDEGYIDYHHNTNWQNIIFNNSISNRFHINVKGGDEIARYGLSVGYSLNNGIIKQTKYNDFNLRFVSRLNIFRWMRMNAEVSMNSTSGNLKESAVSKETSPILTSLAKSPLLNPYQYDEEGREVSILSEVDEIGVSNPLAVIQNFEAKNLNNSFSSFFNFESNINKHLIANSIISLKYNILKESEFLPNHGMEHYYEQEAYNVAKQGNNEYFNIYNNTFLRYQKQFNSNNLLISTIGAHISHNKYQFDYGISKNAHENDQYRDLQSGQNSLREIGGINRTWNYVTIYENLYYSLKDKYLFSASISLDGSSRYGKNAINTIKINGQPFAIFYSGGFAWRISNEPFLKNISSIEDLKLRFSAGVSGNDDIGESNSRRYYKSIKFSQTTGLYPGGIFNDKLSYEKVSQIDAGVDLSMWGNRLVATIDYFNSATNNLLVYMPIEAYLGYDYKVENFGTINNNGIELFTSGRIIAKNNFKFDLSFTLTKIKNVVKDLKGKYFITDIPGGQLINTEGYAINSFYGYKFKGVFTTQEQANNANLLNDKGMPYQAGDAIFEDISGPDGQPDGIINSYDKTIIGSPLADLFGDITTTFSYKRLKLNFVFQYITGNQIFNYLRYMNERMTGLENQSASIRNRWTYEGQVTDVPRALWNDPIGNSAFSSRWIEDGKYLKLKNITLSYKFRERFLSLRTSEIYFSAINILTFSKYLGYYPEFAYSYSQTYLGIDYGQMPLSKQFILGIKLGL
jgi:TonB-linked SusC/RagA family outer membrane protein